MSRLREYRIFLLSSDRCKRGRETRLGIHLYQMQMRDGTENQGLEKEK